MNKKTSGLLLSVLGVISLILITAGVTYAFFSYVKEGETKNQLKAGTITFYYDELNESGKGINITDALPMSDAEGMALTGENNVFNFKITSTVSGDAEISYTVTARLQEGSTLPGYQAKLYLTDKEDGAAIGREGINYTITDGKVNLFSELARPTKDQVVVPDEIDERVIYTGTVPAKTESYTNDLVLRMWIAGNEDDTTTSDFSPYEFVLKSVVGSEPLKADDLIKAGDGSFITSTAYYALDDAARANYERVAYVNMTNRTIYTVSQGLATAPEGYEASEQFYQMSGQEFKIRVNVYADAKVVTAAY